MKKPAVFISLLAVFIAISSSHRIHTVTTSNDAIVAVKKAYPVYKNYPSNTLPPTSVEALPEGDSWRVGMYVEGSGVKGILQAECFLVTKKGEVTQTGQFRGEGPATAINLVTCTPKD